MNRHQRRSSDKKIRKELNSNKDNEIENKLTKQLEDKLNNTISDLGKIYNYDQIIESKFNLLIDTLTSKGICDWQDLANTEGLYRQKEVVKKMRIKQLLQENHSTREYLALIIEDPKLPGYQKLGIDPVSDLNINPYELAQIIRDDYSDNTVEDQFKIGSKLYKLTKQHFGI